MVTLETTSGPHMVSDLKLLNKGRNPNGINFMLRLKICSGRVFSDLCCCHTKRRIGGAGRIGWALPHYDKDKDLKRWDVAACDSYVENLQPEALEVG